MPASNAARSRAATDDRLPAQHERRPAGGLCYQPETLPTVSSCFRSSVRTAIASLERADASGPISAASAQRAHRKPSFARFGTRTNGSRRPTKPSPSSRKTGRRFAASRRTRMRSRFRSWTCANAFRDISSRTSKSLYDKNSLMPAFDPKRLSDGDLSDLVGYLTTLRGYDVAVH